MASRFFYWSGLPRVNILNIFTKRSKNMNKKEIYYVKDISRLIDRDKSTIFRWEKEGRINSPQRDSRGWRIYNEYDLEKMKRVVRELTQMYN